MKTFVLTVSRKFPTTHKRKGEKTNFVEKIEINENLWKGTEITRELSLREFGSPKYHTVRSNYPLWENRIKQVQEGKAILSLRYWSGKPYNSKQQEFMRLDKDSGVGVQKLVFGYSGSNLISDINLPIVLKSDEYSFVELEIDTIATNDGLSLEDFKEWFKKHDLSQPMAIIHFTKFRY